jgi:positive regulator of sigma E activity
VERKPDTGIEISRFLGAGLTWALSTLLFMLAGAWVGQRLGNRPIGAVAGAFVGAAAGFYWLVRQLSAGPNRRDGG